MTYNDQGAKYVGGVLSDIVERLEELEDYCVDQGYRAVENKIQEMIGSLYNAQEAALQYQYGMLTPTEVIF